MDARSIVSSFPFSCASYIESPRRDDEFELTSMPCNYQRPLFQMSDLCENPEEETSTRTALEAMGQIFHENQSQSDDEEEREDNAPPAKHKKKKNASVTVCPQGPKICPKNSLVKKHKRQEDEYSGTRGRPPKYNDGLSGYQRLLAINEELKNTNLQLVTQLGSESQRRTTSLMKQQAEEIKFWKSSYHQLETTSKQEHASLLSQIEVLTECGGTQGKQDTVDSANRHIALRLALLLKSCKEQQETCLQQLASIIVPESI